MVPCYAPPADGETERGGVGWNHAMPHQLTEEQRIGKVEWCRAMPHQLTEEQRRVRVEG